MISIVIPTFNEGSRIRANVLKVHSFLSNLSIAFEVIVADNGSKDNTLAECQNLAESHDWFSLVTLAERGPGAAFKEAVKISKGELIATVDADLSSSLTFLEDAIRHLPSSDIVIGSKTLGTQRRTLIRLLGSHVYIAFVQWLFDLPISDYSIGSKAFRKDKILSILDSLDPWTGYVLELCVYGKLHRLKMVEIPVDCEDHYRSRYNLLYEGFYRYRHLFQLKNFLADSESWLHKPTVKPSKGVS
jgi:glycosyltransferase involved in cell wall biosynthesis